ncbi:unnamed protein product [Urochloa humidicola]
MAAALDAATAAARDGQTALALRLTKNLVAPDGGGNVAFSPVSVHAALALVAAGARGATLAQLLAFLGAPSAEGLAGFGRDVVARRVLAGRAASGGPRVLFGGGVWVDASRGELTDAFREVGAESYNSDARTVSFDKEPNEAAKMINEWVKKATDNLIDSIISPGEFNTETDLVLANAVYFKGEWLSPFRASSTESGTFHRLDGGCSDVKFMSKYMLMHVACMEGFKILKLPYKPGRRQEPMPSLDAAEDAHYSMFVFLPDTCEGFTTMVDVVTASPAFLYSILDEIKSRQVSLKLPKFKITFNCPELDGTLRQLGLTLPFSQEAADLRGMYKEVDAEDAASCGSKRPAFLSKFAHMAVLDVNELGTEAAALKWGLYGGGHPPPDLVEFVADHPFTFFIMEERSGVIVFTGHVLDPA